MLIDLVCVDEGYKDQTFQMSLGHESAVLIAPDGSEIGTFSLADAATKFSLPSKLNCAPWFTITEGDKNIHFKLGDEQTKQLRQFTLTAMVRQGPEFLSAQRQFIWKVLAFGLICTTVGSGVVLASYFGAISSRGGGVIFVPTGLLVLGVGALIGCMAQYRHVRAIERLTREQQGEGLPL